MGPALQEEEEEEEEEEESPREEEEESRRGGRWRGAWGRSLYPPRCSHPP